MNKNIEIYLNNYCINFCLFLMAQIHLNKKLDSALRTAMLFFSLIKTAFSSVHGLVNASVERGRGVIDVISDKINHQSPCGRF